MPVFRDNFMEKVLDVLYLLTFVPALALMRSGLIQPFLLSYFAVISKTRGSS